MNERVQLGKTWEGGVVLRRENATPQEDWCDYQRAVGKKSGGKKKKRRRSQKGNLVHVAQGWADPQSADLTQVLESVSGGRRDPPFRSLHFGCACLRVLSDEERQVESSALLCC